MSVDARAAQSGRAVSVDANPSGTGATTTTVVGAGTNDARTGQSERAVRAAPAASTARTITVAVAGKGGTGKTTIAGLVVRTLRERGVVPILAIDADPSSNLHAVLGLQLGRTVGDIRERTVERARSGQLEAGVAKADLLDYEVSACLEEGEGVDLLAMGRPEGPGCYCAANTMLRTIVDRIAGSYRAVVMDTEAGLEHLSRRTTRDVDVLLVVTDPTLRGVAAARRVVTLVQELGTRFGAVHVLANRVDGDLPAAVQEAIAAAGLELVATLKCDPLVGSFDAIGRPLVELPDDDVTLGAVRALVDRLVLGEAALRPAAQGAAAQEAAALEAATLGAAAKGEVAC